MHSQFNETVDQIKTWTQTDSRVKGIVIIGSQARSVQLADQWSDLDLMVLVDDPNRLVSDNTWFSRFGQVACFFDEIVPLHSFQWNWCVKRVLYDDGRDVDFSVLPYTYLDEVLGVNKDIICRGNQVLYDADSGRLQEKIDALLADFEERKIHFLTEDAMYGVVRDLLYHVVWSYKKIRRGELWVAVNCINCYMKELLLQLIEMHNATITQSEDFLQYTGRFLEQRSSQKIIQQFKGCFTKYDPQDAVNTLEHLFNFIYSLTTEICEKNGYRFDAVLFDRMKKLFNTMKEYPIYEHP